MLDRRAILRKVAAFGWRSADYWLITGAAMVLHGARDVTRDIDIGVTPSFADALIRAGAVFTRGADGMRKIALSEDIEIFENWGAGQTEMIRGVHALTIDGLIEMKTALGRPKDQRDIALLHAHQSQNATRVYFVRHARPNYENHDDLTRELTKRGLFERMLAADFLRDKNVQAVLSSPYRRAVQTVEPLAKELGAAVEVVDGFRERRVDSAWIPDFDDFTRRQWADFNYKLADGESLGEVQARSVAALKDVVSRYRGKTVAIGAHGTALSALINHFEPSFGFSAFTEIRGRMPWIVRFTFDGDVLAGIEKINLFEIEN